MPARTLGDVLDAMARNRQALSDRVAALRANKNLSPEGLRREIEQAHRAAVEKHRELAADFRAAVAAEHHNLKKTALEAPTRGDPTLIRQAYKESLAAKPVERRKLLGQARLLGDANLLHGLLMAAHEVGDREILANLVQDDTALDRLLAFEDGFVKPSPNRRFELSTLTRAPSIPSTPPPGARPQII